MTNQTALSLRGRDRPAMLFHFPVPVVIMSAVIAFSIFVLSMEICGEGIGIRCLLSCSNHRTVWRVLKAAPLNSIETSSSNTQFIQRTRPPQYSSLAFPKPHPLQFIPSNCQVPPSITCPPSLVDSDRVGRTGLLSGPNEDCAIVLFRDVGIPMDARNIDTTPSANDANAKVTLDISSSYKINERSALVLTYGQN